MKINLILSVTFLVVASVARVSADPTLKANPNPVIVPAGQTQSKTTLTWNTEGPDGYVWVSVDGAEESQLNEAGIAEGTLEATAEVGKSYGFKLYTADKEQLLASVTVTVVVEQPAPPPAAQSPPTARHGRVRPPPARKEDPAQFVGSNDFNDDGNGDILWHNASTGESQIWFMKGSSRIGRATVLGENGRAALVGGQWSIVGTNDFRRFSFEPHGRETDLLWHNSSTGETQIWSMKGDKGDRIYGRSTVLDEHGSAAFLGLPWSIVGTNSFNRDGTADILWHNSSTGEMQIWYMNGQQVTGRATVLDEHGSAAFVGLPWSIVGTNDFREFSAQSRDGETDLLCHNSSTGETQIWYMKGYRVYARSTVLDEHGSAAFVGLPWSIVGTNDFNRDGAADILWHNSSTGETQIWFMNGRWIVRRATVDAVHDGGGALVGPPWSIMNH